jgi:hypothetical protein
VAVKAKGKQVEVSVSDTDQDVLADDLLTASNTSQSKLGKGSRFSFTLPIANTG